MSANAKPLVWMYLCDSTLAMILRKKMEHEGLEVKVFSDIEDVLTRGSTKPVKGLLLDVECQLSVKELVASVKSKPVLHRAFIGLYSKVLLPGELEMVREKHVGAVYIGALQSTREIAEHFAEEIESTNS